MSEVDVGALVPQVRAILREKSRSKVHKRDPEAWLADVLDKRWWSKQAQIAHMVVDPTKDQTFTVVKSANGTGKTQVAADLMTWAVAVHDPLEVTVLATATVFDQVRTNAFRYIADNYGIARARSIALPGRITADPALRFDRSDGGKSKDLIIARRPADSNLISSFQGTHDGYVMVVLDEAGGLPDELWIGAYAVTTNKHVAILAIGNPDQVGTPFHQRFLQPDKYKEWSRATISAFDTPNLTGEMIYPDDLERDAFVKEHMIQPEWVERMRREAHPSVYQAKVLGEFPESADSAFFPQPVIDLALNAEIDPGDSPSRKLGVDLSFLGDDKSVAYLNVGGRIRKVDEWTKEDNPRIHARRVHQVAKANAATEVRVDASGAGATVFAILAQDDEFRDRVYDLYGVRGGAASPDNNVWAQVRSWQYDQFRQHLQEGKIDLDFDDTELRDELTAQTYQVNAKGAIQITPKDQMRKAGIHSPDHLDAAIYSDADPDPLYGAEVRPGEMVEFDTDALDELSVGFYAYDGF